MKVANVVSMFFAIMTSCNPVLIGHLAHFAMPVPVRRTKVKTILLNSLSGPSEQLCLQSVSGDAISGRIQLLIPG
ncbi:hypothetical protein V6N11_011199 [Hibiscus sabdariffa]|uniref:Secreted protein n=1 Tax=Hibiscus sabdariffa TaxID=183260 RepID=A0ABR2S7J9_9ROSI